MTAPDTALLQSCREQLGDLEPIAPAGRVCSFVGTVIEAEGLHPPVGAVCHIEPRDGLERVAAEVIGFRRSHFLLMPLEPSRAVGPGDRIRMDRSGSAIPAGDACLGRVLDGMGRPIDGGPALQGASWVPLYRKPEDPLARQPICEPLDLGVRALNTFATAGRGMRLGIFAGSGVGKSTLLGQIARHTDADVTVIGLVGERGREVREFIERDLGDSLARSTLVVATSDEAPLMRVRAAHAATAIAEQHRDCGRNVLLLMDSLTRFCVASREIGLAAGEPPTSRGYTPSVWSSLPRLLERVGTSPNAGSITGIYTVLVEGDDPNEPVSDMARSLLDGHVALSREIAQRGDYPAVDVLASVSRVMTAVASEEHLRVAARARELLATHRGAEDLIAVGAYQAGSDPAIDTARAAIGGLRQFLRQQSSECARLDQDVAALASVLRGAGA